MNILPFPLESVACRLIALTAFAVGITHATAVDYTAGSIVTNELDVNGNFIDLGAWSDDAFQKAVSLIYSESSAAGAFELRIARNTAGWVWSHGTSVPPVAAMKLDSTHRLLLLDNVAVTGNAGIVLDPIGASTLFSKAVTFSANGTFNGTNNRMPNQTLVDGSSLLTQSIGNSLYPLKSLFSLNTTGAPSTTSATASYSSAFGQGTTASADSQFVVGKFNTLNSTDGLFIVGKGTGTATANRSNAFTVKSNGDAVVAGKLTATSISPTSGSLALNSPVTIEGALNVNGNASFSGGITASSIAGPSNYYLYLSGNVNSYANIYSNGSFQSNGIKNGYVTTSSSSIATGYGSSASGASSFASGNYTTAGGTGSVALGVGSTTAINKDAAFASGSYTIAEGFHTSSFGYYTTARSYGSAAFGRYNTYSSADNQDAWVDTDPLFVIGNGTSTSNKRNAMLMLKNGATAIGLGLSTNTPAQTVVGKYNDTTVALPVNKTLGIFVVGAGSGVVGGSGGIPQTQNALRVLDDGSVLVQAKGDLSMGTFIDGTAP